jgi:hypothetical protein
MLLHDEASAVPFRDLAARLGRPREVAFLVIDLKTHL